MGDKPVAFDGGHCAGIKPTIFDSPATTKQQSPGKGESRSIGFFKAHREDVS